MKKFIQFSTKHKAGRLSSSIFSDLFFNGIFLVRPAQKLNSPARTNLAEEALVL